MTDIKDLLRLAVEDEPPGAFDVGRILASGRRRLRRRRIAMAGAAVLGVVAVAAAVLSLGMPALWRSAPPATREAPAPPGAERASQLARMLANLPILPDGMQRAPAGDRLVDPTAFTAIRSSYSWGYTQHGDLTDAQGSGNLEVNVTTSGTYPDCTASSVPGLTCTHRRGPDGADLVVYHQTGEGGWSGTAVLRRLPDGSWASAWTSSLSWRLVKEGWSYTEVGWLEVPAGVQPTRPAPPLPVERLIDIVTALAA